MNQKGNKYVFAKTKSLNACKKRIGGGLPLSAFVFAFEASSVSRWLVRFSFASSHTGISVDCNYQLVKHGRPYGNSPRSFLQQFGKRRSKRQNNLNPIRVISNFVVNQNFMKVFIINGS